MRYQRIEWTDLSITVRLGNFRPANGVAELHAMLELNDISGNTETQYRRLEDAVQRLTRLTELEGTTLVWKRFFVSDAVNQAPYLNPSAGEAVSVVQQPPLNGAKASLWLYFAEDVQLFTDTDRTIMMKRPDHEHLFHVQMHRRTGDAAYQTREIFGGYSRSLSHKECTLEKHGIRTWIFVQDVDVQYAGMVAARKDHFNREGLTEKTHYIASTGIEGRYIYPETLILMDAYAVTHLMPGQVRYLQASTHLNPTYEYGVTFERGTTVDYGDRRHVFISGTASINHRGEIVHPLDIEKQVARTFENIQALLTGAEATMQDLAYMIVYLRDTADNAIVNKYMEQHYPHIPRVVVWAPVCRPGWLVEVECMAIKQVKNTQFAAF